MPILYHHKVSVAHYQMVGDAQLLPFPLFPPRSDPLISAERDGSHDKRQVSASYYPSL